MKQKTVLICCVLMLCLACNSPVSEDMTIIVLFDVSGSMYGKDNPKLKEIRSKYLGQAKEQVIPKFCVGDRLLGNKISDSPFREGNYELNQEIKPFSFIQSYSDEKYKTDLKKQKDEIAKKFAEWLGNNNQIKNTCLLDSISVATDVFREYPTSKKSLVIFSDMLESCNNLNFETGVLSDADIQKIIKDIESKQGKPLLNQLQNVEVYISGASGGLSGNDDSNRYHSVRKFWEAYFQKAGANVHYQQMNFRPEIAECDIWKNWRIY